MSRRDYYFWAQTFLTIAMLLGPINIFLNLLLPTGMIKIGIMIVVLIIQVIFGIIGFFLGKKSLAL